jgi:ABC-type uncharacterized transport system involved in gliding motility auxiliary subunit
MATQAHAKPSFSPYRKWGIGLHVGFLVLVVLAVMVMVNILSRDYFLRVHWSTRTRNALSPLTLKFLESITNQVKVTLYYDKDDSLYSMIAGLLYEYQTANPKISVQTIDYLRDAGSALKLKDKYSALASPQAKDLVIFDCDGRSNVLKGRALADYVKEGVGSESAPFRQKVVAFEGERAFTAALLAVTNPKPLKAYFLQDDGEHPIDSGDEQVGYLKLATVLDQNYIQAEKLSLLGTNPVPGDCNLLVIAGPTSALSETALKKIDHYLDQGGRLLALFNYLSIRKETGLEKILGKWGVEVGNRTIIDPENTTDPTGGADVIVGRFGQHPVVNPLLLLKLQLILPRAVGKLASSVAAADAPQVEEIAFSGPNAFAKGGPAREPRAYPLITAVEKGAIKDVVTERGNTRMLIVGDSYFLANRQIGSAANRDFAAYAVNWLLDRAQLLEGLGPRPVAEYKFGLTTTEFQTARWILLAGMPGFALLLGALVWLRRRR